MSEEAAEYRALRPKVKEWTPEEIKSAIEKYTAWRPFMIRTRDGREFAFTHSKTFRPTANFRVIYYMGPECSFPQAIDFFEVAEICDCPAPTVET
jgi:hypothetical protein